MNKNYFIALVGLMTIIILMMGYLIVTAMQDKVVVSPQSEVVLQQSDRPIETTGDVCAVCGRDRVTAHGGIFLKNITQREVKILVRHHPDASELVVRLDPNGFKMIDEILVGTMKLRFLGEGFDEETYCTILANTTHEMWWTIHGVEMHGMTQQHIGH